jgi:hypothetical protein
MLLSIITPHQYREYARMGQEGRACEREELPAIENSGPRFAANATIFVSRFSNNRVFLY